MDRHHPMRVAYILKMYPRFSETFIVNEILAHEAAGLPLEIFSLRAPVDGRFHETYAHVQARVTYVPQGESKPSLFWTTLRQAGAEFPALWAALAENPAVEATDISQAIWLARSLPERGITHLHAHFGSAATTVAWLVSRMTGIPYGFTAHAKDIFHESVIPADLRHKLHDAAYVITVSDFNVAYLRRHYGEAAARVQRIYNGLDLARFPFTSPAERPRQILAVGRLVEKKGFDVLVEACAILRRRGSVFSCTIIGGGEQEAALRAQVQRLGLQKQVRFLGPQPQGEVIRHLQNAAVFAAPCLVGKDGNRDGLPTVLLEAMALGTPCVSTDVTGIPEVICHGRTGLLVPQEDPRELAAALERLLDDARLRIELATEARALIEAQFDIHRNSAQIRRLFKPAVAAPGVIMPAPSAAWIGEAV